MPLALAADRKPVFAFLDFHLFERLEVLLDIRPFKLVAGIGQPLLQLFPQYQGQKTAKNMAGNVCVILMIYRPGLQHGFHVPEYPFYLPQLLILQSNDFS